MNLTFRHSGLQFFFITLTLEGRPPMLSRLIEGEARPVLLPAGEVVQAYFAGVSRRLPGGDHFRARHHARPRAFPHDRAL